MQPRPISHLTNSKVAIPTHTYKTSNTTQGQDVPPAIISAATFQTSTAPRNNVYAIPFYGTTVSNPSASTHVLNQPISQRPRTSSQVFTSSHDLVAHYGLPQTLPPVPSMLPRRTQPQPDPAPSIHPSISTFNSLVSNYTNMLAQKPTDNSTAVDSAQPLTNPVSPAELVGQAKAVNEERLQDILKQDMSPVSPDLNTPELSTSPDFEWPVRDFLSSPAYNSPFDDFLTTPVIGDEGDMFTELMEAGGYSLFPELNHSYVMEFEKPAPPMPPLLPYAKLYQMSPVSPVSPAMNDFNTPPSVNPASIYPLKCLPSDLSAFPSSPASPSTPSSRSIRPLPSSRRKSSATGTRKGVTPEALVPIDAPTQPRKYVTPSVTSRKEVPSMFMRKRNRVEAFVDDEDELLEELRPDATELEQIEYKRRQNTVAARRSRKRKLEFQQKLLDDVEHLQRARDMWRERARMLMGMMEVRGIPCPRFPPDEDEA